MSLLDDTGYTPRFTPGKSKKRYTAENEFKSEEEKLSELNNMGREEVTEDYSDSPHADRV